MKVVFQTGLTGCVLLLNPVHPVILSRMKKPQMKAPRVTPLEGVSTYREAIRVVWESRTVRFRSENPQGFGIDERRLIAPSHRKGREERKVQQQKSLRSGTGITPRRRTRMTRIGRIFTDDLIRAYPCHLCNPCSIVYNSDGKISYQWHFSSITEQEAAR